MAPVIHRRPIRFGLALSAEAAERVAPDYLVVCVGHSGGDGSRSLSRSRGGCELR
jgi:hypothetical protein